MIYFSVREKVRGNGENLETYDYFGCSCVSTCKVRHGDRGSMAMETWIHFMEL